MGMEPTCTESPAENDAGVQPALAAPDAVPISSPDMAEMTELWSIGIYTGRSPLRLSSAAGISNPVLTARDVLDAPARFVADPFMILDKGTWYMFFEVMNSETGLGEIGLATSLNGLQWDYRQIVLRERFHLSYPYVFKWGRDFYMVPETLGAESVVLYKAIKFPACWARVAALIPGVCADPSLFRFDGRWWMFACPRPSFNDTLCLYYSDRLNRGWREHSGNPIIKGDASTARPAGRITRWRGRLIRFAQDCVPNYGTSVRAFEISQLSPTAYAEEEIAESPILTGGTASWNSSGMHNVDPHPSGQGWLACVDGWRPFGSVPLENSSPRTRMQLNYWKDSWPLDVAECPCDVHFLEYLRKHNIKDKIIFHFGTGDHHLLGKENPTESPNEIFAVTASWEEYESYARFIIDNPVAAKYYKALFGDIYTLTSRIVPDFDLVTLFHLCEFYDEARSAYAELNDSSLLDLFISKLKPGGRILFYKRSSHFWKARRIIKDFTERGKLTKQDEYKTLLVYTPA